MAVFYGIHRIDKIAMRFYGIRGILSVPRNPSMEFFQFHGIRGNWWNLAAHFHRMPWNFYITSGSTILPSFFMETTASTKKFRPNTPRQYSTEFHHDSMAYLQTGLQSTIYWDNPRTYIRKFKQNSGEQSWVSWSSLILTAIQYFSQVKYKF